jgi:hypothetical protein
LEYVRRSSSVEASWLNSTRSRNAIRKCTPKTQSPVITSLRRACFWGKIPVKRQSWPKRYIQVYSEEPSVSAFAATYAFSLMRAHQPEKALQVLQKLPQTAMADASIGLCYGLALAATGQKEVGKNYLESALNSGRLFPEEQALAHNALGGL